MSSAGQDRILSGAYAVLSKARRSMHYTQIASVGTQLGLFQSDSKSIHIMVSSLLSADIRTNPASLFVKKRPGIYTLSTRGLVGTSQLRTLRSDSDGLLSHLHESTGIPARSALLNKALYLAGRTIDVGGRGGCLTYCTLNDSQSIDIDIVELTGEFSKADADAFVEVLANLSQEALTKARQIALRLALEDLSVVVGFSLFLLELATDVIGSNRLLVIKSSHSSIRMTVRSGQYHDS